MELNGLLEHYQKGRFDLAENLAKNLTQKYPDHQFSWKVLGVVFQQTGRLQESLIANQRAVAISPNDAKAHERGKGDHCYIDGKEVPYAFTSVEKLLEDFIAAVKTRRAS